MEKRNGKGQFVKGAFIKDLTGKRFGKLTVIGLDKIVNRKSYWKVKCDCGTEKSVRGDTLRVITSCGCVKKEQDKKNLHILYNHNMTNHPVFFVWSAMMNRCYNKHQKSYENYGKRGISVCEEWHDVKVFCRWAENNGYQEGLTIERIDVNKNYEPVNCKWIPANEQAWNTRKTVYADINGERIPLARRARELGIEPGTVWHRWKRGIKDYKRLFFKGNLAKDYY